MASCKIFGAYVAEILSDEVIDSQTNTFKGFCGWLGIYSEFIRYFLMIINYV